MMAAARLDSLPASLPRPAMRDSPAQKAASTATTGKRSGAWLRSKLNASRGALRTQMVPSSSCETMAPASISTSIMAMSACMDFMSMPSISALPNTAPATRNPAAALQSLSMLKSAAL